MVELRKTGTNQYDVLVDERHDLVGVSGTVRECWGNQDYSALDIELEDGRTKLLWFHQLEVVEQGETPSGAERYLLRW